MLYALERKAPQGNTFGSTRGSSSLHNLSEGKDKSLQPKINKKIKHGEGKANVLALF